MARIDSDHSKGPERNAALRDLPGEGQVNKRSAHMVKVEGPRERPLRDKTGSLLTRFQRLADRAMKVMLPASMRSRRMQDAAHAMPIDQLIDSAIAALQQQDWEAAPLAVFFNKTTGTVDLSMFAKMSTGQVLAWRGGLETAFLAQPPDSVHAMLVIARRSVEERTVVARDGFLSAYHQTMLVAGDPNGKAADLVNAVIEASRHFETLGQCGGLGGQHKELIEQYRTDLSGLKVDVEQLEPLQRPSLDLALLTLGISLKTDV